MRDRADYEAAFRRAGLPLFIEGRSASQDVWTRALPLLVLIFWGEMFGAIDLEWSLLENIAALSGGVAILLGAWVLSNRLRGRPALARPQDVGPWELGGFVVIPPLLPAVLNGQTTSAFVTAGANLFTLALLYGVIAYGLMSIIVWVGRRLASQLLASLTLLARAIPLLLLFAVVLLVNTEMWQTFGDMGNDSLVATACLLVGVGTLFLVMRLPREVSALEAEVGEGPELDNHERMNVGLVMFVSQALQVLVVSAAVYAFFIVFGMLTISDSVFDAWLGHGAHRIVDFEVAGVRIQVARELLHVAGAIAALSGLYYSIAVLTDATYREEFLEELTSEMRESFAARAAYLRLVRPSAS